jgi:hypothetical protein
MKLDECDTRSKGTYDFQSRPLKVYAVFPMSHDALPRKSLSAALHNDPVEGVTSSLAWTKWYLSGCKSSKFGKSR